MIALVDLQTHTSKFQQQAFANAWHDKNDLNLFLLQRHATTAQPSKAAQSGLRPSLPG